MWRARSLFYLQTNEHCFRINREKYNFDSKEMFSLEGQN